MELEVQPYDPTQSDVWDHFVLSESANGTVFHTRRFLAYHPDDRFDDASAVFRDGDTIAAVVPACVDDGGYFSHAGTSFGGPVVRSDRYRVKHLVPLVEILLDHYDDRFGARLAPSIFASVDNDPLVYLLGRVLDVRRELSIYCPLRRVDDYVDRIPRQSTRTAVRQLRRSGFEVSAAQSEEEYRAFHGMVTQNLAKHDVAPTHSVEELLALRKLLGDRQLLLLGREGEPRPTAGTWLVKASERAWHTFYVAKDYDRGHHSAVPAVLVRAMEVASAEGAAHVNLGICTEEEGQSVNVGLCDFKESLGGNAINRYVLAP